MAVTPPDITKRLVKAQPLTASEMDTNLGDLLDYTTDVESSYSGGTGAITGLCLTNLTVPIGSINPTGSTSGQVLTSAGDSTSAAWQTGFPLAELTHTGNTAGAVAYHDGSKWTVLAPGTAGQHLKSNGTGAPAWETPASTNLVQASTTTGDTCYSTTFQSSGLSASITPTATTSKILITVVQQRQVMRTSGTSSGTWSARAQLVNGSTVIWGPTRNAAAMYMGTYDNNESGDIVITYLDAPASTSEQTYTCQHAKGTEGESYSSEATTGTITLWEII